MPRTVRINGLGRLCVLALVVLAASCSSSTSKQVAPGESAKGSSRNEKLVTRNGLNSKAPQPVTAMDKNGVKVILPSYPFAALTMLFLREADGKISPVRVDSIEIVRKDQKWACNYMVEGTGLKLGVGKAQDLRTLVMGQSYFLRGLPGEVEFSVPQMQEGEEWSIEIIAPPLPKKAETIRGK